MKGKAPIEGFGARVISLQVGYDSSSFVLSMRIYVNFGEGIN